MVGQARGSERVFQDSLVCKGGAEGADRGCRALFGRSGQVMLGQADDLGGGVFRSVWKESIPFHSGRGGRAVLGLRVSFCKEGQSHIGDEELAKFRKLAKVYQTLTDQQVDELTQDNSGWRSAMTDKHRFKSRLDLVCN